MAHTRILIFENESDNTDELLSRLEAAGCHILDMIETDQEIAAQKFQDLFHPGEIQKIQDVFGLTTGVASQIVDPEGRPITKPASFYAFCTDTANKTGQSKADSIKCETVAGWLDPNGPTIQTRLIWGGLWEGGARISLGAIHIANWLAGPVIDADADTERLVAHACEYGVDESTFREALGRMKRMSKAQFENVCQSLFLIIEHLARATFQNARQARYIVECHRLEEQLRQAQKMEAVGQLAGGVAHDFNNILSTILLHLYMVKSDPGITESILSQLSELEIEARRATDLTRQLLLFSRRKTMRTLRVDINEILTGMVKMLGRLLGEHIVLTLRPDNRVGPIQGDPGMIEQVVMNLCLNARDAMPNGGQLIVSTKMAEFDDATTATTPNSRPGKFSCIEIADTGAGMDKATLQHIFEPFFTTKPAGKGTGLGLATIDSIVKQHHGWIQVDSTPGQGSSFRVYLPTVYSQDEIQEPVKSTPVEKGSETILLVEDEAGVRQMMTSCFKRNGYRVLEANDGVQALTIWNRHQAEIDLLFTDVVLPEGISGLDLATRLKQDKSSLKMIITSGYSDEAFHRDIPAQEGVIFLPKPYDPEKLIETVRTCLDKK